MQRDFHFRLADQHEGSEAEYRTRLKIDASSIHIDLTMPGDEMPRGVWIEVIGGNVYVQTYDPAHEGPKTTIIEAGWQQQHADGYD